MQTANQQGYILMYEKMLLIRYAEQKLEELFGRGLVHGTTHLYIGEEAVAAGVCCALGPTDAVFSTHRGHGHCIAKGMDLRSMMAEFLGRETGCCKGRGGSMHLADMERGLIGTNGIVGGGLPLAVGAALAFKMRAEKRIVACFFGDGAANEGTFHESLNLASVWKLPVLFVCEDNKYGLSMAKNRSMNIEDISSRAAGYGIAGQTVDGNDAPAVFSAVKTARKHVLCHGPMLLVCDTYRISGHSKSDKNVYRTQEEIAYWKQKDPIKRMEGCLLEKKLVTFDEIKAIQARALDAVEEAVAFAQCSPFPSAEHISSGVYA